MKNVLDVLPRSGDAFITSVFLLLFSFCFFKLQNQFASFGLNSFPAIGGVVSELIADQLSA